MDFRNPLFFWIREDDQKAAGLSLNRKGTKYTKFREESLRNFVYFVPLRLSERLAAFWSSSHTQKNNRFPKSILFRFPYITPASNNSVANSALSKLLLQFIIPIIITNSVQIFYWFFHIKPLTMKQKSTSKGRPGFIIAMIGVICFSARWLPW